MFYDCEQLRTYALSTGGEFVPARRLARGGARVRWITRLTGDALGQDPHSAVLAVVSRDQRQVIVAGRAGPATGFTLATNTLFTCLHADSSVPLAAGQQATTREVFWFLEGTLDTCATGFREFAERSRRDRPSLAGSVSVSERSPVGSRPSGRQVVISGEVRAAP